MISSRAVSLIQPLERPAISTLAFTAGEIVAMQLVQLLMTVSSPRRY